jgi:sulfatase maturation enzyme AslB (radical SAM superfamily)
MKINSLSIVIPTNNCINSCKFCCSESYESHYKNLFKETKNSNKLYYRKSIKQRLQFAQLHNVDTIVLTSSSGEVLQNMEFLDMLGDILEEMKHPFPRIELQTSGIMLTEENLRFLRDINVNTISISVSNLFDNERNLELIGVPTKLRFSIEHICELINSFNFNIRLSLNLTKDYIGLNPEEYFIKANQLGATHLTFRKLYASENITPVDIWVNENRLNDVEINKINEYIKNNGKALYVLPFGFTAYSVHNLSTVLDDDCMDSSKQADDILKYLILRENAKLYSQWSDVGSIIY